MSHLHKLHGRMLLTAIELLGFPPQHSRSEIAVTYFPMWLMLSTAAERNRSVWAVTVSPLGPPVDTTFVPHWPCAHKLLSHLFLERGYFMTWHAITDMRVVLKHKSKYKLGCVVFNHVMFLTLKVRVINIVTCRLVSPLPVTQ